MTNLKRKSRLSVRKSHPDLRQGGLLEGNGSIPQKKRKSCANGDSEWGPRYRSSEEEERVLYHRSWCGVEEKALFSGKSRTGEDEQWKAVVLKAPCGRGLDSSAAYGQYLFPAGPRNGASNLGQIVHEKPRRKPIPVSSTTRPPVEEKLPTFSPEVGAAVRLPAAYLDNPKLSASRHPRRSVYDIYFGDDFGPDFEAAQVATRLSADVLSE